MSSSLTNLFIMGMLAMGLSTPANAKDLVRINPPALGDPTPLGYSTAVVIPAGSRIALISGQAGFDDRGQLPADFATQVKNTYANLAAALEGIGAKPNQVAKLTIYVVNHDMSKLGLLTQSVVEMFGSDLPAQTLVSAPKLALDAMLFEVEAVVALD
jgi:enamine deaminase RidA (YjgF/YER057c/UK114 family)